MLKEKRRHFIRRDGKLKVFRPHRACFRSHAVPYRRGMSSKVAPTESLTSENAPVAENQRPGPATESAPTAKPARLGKVVKHLPMMKALASRARLTAIELCIDGSAFTATALQTPMRMSARRAADHMRILCHLGVLLRRVGTDRREMEYAINPAFVRKADDGTAILDFGSGQLNFPRVRLGE
jgi:hypothetical protein